jgi:cation/acetate symporter
LRALKEHGAELSQLMQARRELAALPRDAEAARESWTRAMQVAQERAQPLGGLPRQGQAFAGDPDGTPAEQAAFDGSRLNWR